MFRTLCKSKITNAVITGKELQYDGSIGIDKTIMEASDILAGEQVHVLNANNGERFTTYVIEEKPNSGRIILYGPAARKGEVGDGLVILSYCLLETKESHNFSMRTISLAKNNQCKIK
ncbi:MAG: aspartate 1-decarboxylase [Candidatus Omnitrophica bacterium]|nr:aspartate 1-decarboxylase [Candidatus Omnitrophota bacterium]MDD5487974.1 aspartate 1-decarboxylase [Candidatus Omnitrophota bacterium]